jgi:hypothetical protein
MATTPPPPRRLHTPPAPLHGSNHDAYEPYSPRRSSRVAAQRERFSQPISALPKGSPVSRRQRATTPTGSKDSVRTSSSQVFSPPSSPISPFKTRIARSARRSQAESAAIDSDSDQPGTKARYLSVMESSAMFPTPAKTPRKRALKSEESLGSTARVLFANRPTDFEDAMPSPRKSRKSRKAAFSLDGYADNADESNEKIVIYTDSKERIPELDDTEDNPFITRKDKPANGHAAAGPSRRRTRDSRTEKMEEAVARDEGMIYVL